jgi:hypothetical protein
LRAELSISGRLIVSRAVSADEREPARYCHTSETRKSSNDQNKKLVIDSSARILSRKFHILLLA